MKKRTAIMAAFIGMLSVSSAYANDVAVLSDNEDSFETAAVADADLDTVRGTGFNINGIAFDFSYLQYVSVINVDHNINEVMQTSINSANLSITSPEQLAQIFQPLILNNTLDGTQINALRELTIIAPGSLNDAVQSGINAQAVYATMMAARGL